MNHQRKLINFFGAVVLAVPSIGVNAALVTYDDYGYDTISNLDWLNTNLTENYSYNQIKSMTLQGGLFEGWRHATTNEFQALVNHTPQENTVISKLDNLGYFLGGSFFYISGIYKTVWGVHARDASGIESTVSKLTYFGQYLGQSDWIAYDYDESQNYNEDYASGYIGHFLVREHASPVPAPAAIWLFGSGLLGLIGLARKKAA